MAMGAGWATGEAALVLRVGDGGCGGGPRSSEGPSALENREAGPRGGGAVVLALLWDVGLDPSSGSPWATSRMRGGVTLVPSVVPATLIRPQNTSRH